MFDISFFKLVVIGVVALIVVGPERLPKVARTAGMLFARFQRYVSGIKADISREFEMEELRRLRAEVEASARQIEETVKRELQSAEASLKQPVAALEEEVKEIRGSLEETAALVHGQSTQEAEVKEPSALSDPTSGDGELLSDPQSVESGSPVSVVSVPLPVDPSIAGLTGDTQLPEPLPLLQAGEATGGHDKS